jgi:hypothetical protein
MIIFRGFAAIGLRFLISLTPRPPLLQERGEGGEVVGLIPRCLQRKQSPELALGFKPIDLVKVAFPGKCVFVFIYSVKLPGINSVNPLPDQVIPLLIPASVRLYLAVIINKVRTLKTKAMKTTKFFSILSLVLIIAAVSAVLSTKALTGDAKQAGKATYRYEVYVKIQSDLSFCNTYVVQLSDEKGKPVAHPQLYVSGIDKYVFTEVVSPRPTVRVASFEVFQNPALLGCPINLFTKPDINTGPFVPFETYVFMLLPQPIQNMEKE